MFLQGCIYGENICKTQKHSDAQDKYNYQFTGLMIQTYLIFHLERFLICSFFMNIFSAEGLR